MQVVSRQQSRPRQAWQDLRPVQSQVCLLIVSYSYATTICWQQTQCNCFQVRLQGCSSGRSTNSRNRSGNKGATTAATAAAATAATTAVAIKVNLGKIFIRSAAAPCRAAAKVPTNSQLQLRYELCWQQTQCNCFKVLLQGCSNGRSNSGGSSINSRNDSKQQQQQTNNISSSNNRTSSYNVNGTRR
jgi:hypothetical protein